MRAPGGARRNPPIPCQLQRSLGSNANVLYCLPDERAVSSVNTPHGPELLVCPRKAYIAANLLTGLQNTVPLSCQDYCDVTVDSDSPLHDLDLFVPDLPRINVIGLLSLRADGSCRWSHQRVIVSVDLM